MSRDESAIDMSRVDQGQNWRDQEWVDLLCPRCGRGCYGPEGNTYCGWHPGEQITLVPVLTAGGQHR